MKTYLAYLCLIVISFVVVGIVFSIQINRFSMNEKHQQLGDTAVRAADMAVVLEEDYSLATDRIFQISIEQLSEENNITVVITDTKGEIIVLAEPQVTLNDKMLQISEEVINTIQGNGYFISSGTLSGTLSHDSYILGIPVNSASGGYIGYVFTMVSTADANKLLSDIMQMFIAIVLLTLLVSIAVSYFLADKMTRPLKTMAEASRKFAKGEFDVRVAEDNRCNEIDELAASFNDMATSLQKHEEVSRGFIANVSHELKTPMTSITGFVEGMLDGTIPPQKHEQYLQLISTEVRRLSRLVVRMLDAARLQSETLKLNPVTFDLCETTMTIVLSFENQINNRYINVNLDFCDRLVINGDKDMIFRAIYNLVDNAVKFVNDEGFLGIKISYIGNKAQFEITNSGAFIPPDELGHIFDRFYKVDKSRSRDVTGAGLGLFLVKNIINLHGGEISVSIKRDIITFSFELPIK